MDKFAIWIRISLSFFFTIILSDDIPHLNMDLNEENFGENANRVHCEGILPNEKCWPQSGPTCLDKRNILGLKGHDEFVIVPAFIYQDIQLDCHYCNERDQDVPKIWYYNDRLFTSSAREVPQHLELPLQQRKFLVDEYHSLTIRNFSESEGAIYFCQGLNDDSSKFNFLIDVVPSQGGPEPILGDSKEYEKYYKNVVKPINKALAKEYLLEIKSWIKVKDNANFDITYEWSSWGGCNVCGRDAGIKRRHGKCNLAIPVSPNEGNETIRRKGPMKNMKFGIQFSCQSLLLERFLSEALVKRIRQVPDFVENSKCKGTCLIDLNFDKDWNEGESSKNFEFVTIWKQTDESLILACPTPRSDLGSDVAWVKDEKFISSNILQKVSGHLSLSVRNDLQFHYLRLNDKGNYTCFINNVPSYAYDVKITLRQKNDQDVSWVWTAMEIFSLTSFIIWIFLVCIIRRVSERIQTGYKPLSAVEDNDARAFRNLKV